MMEGGGTESANGTNPGYGAGGDIGLGVSSSSSPSSSLVVVVGGWSSANLLVRSGVKVCLEIS